MLICQLASLANRATCHINVESIVAITGVFFIQRFTILPEILNSYFFFIDISFIKQTKIIIQKYLLEPRSSESLNKKLARFDNDGRRVAPELTQLNGFFNIQNSSSHEVYAVY